MNEKEKESVEIVADNLTRLAHGLAADEFISRGDMARVLRARAEQLHGILAGNVELSDVRGETDEPLPRPKSGEQLKRLRSVRGTGIEFKRHFSPRFVRLVGSFVSPTGDRNSNHVYEVAVNECSFTLPTRWTARATVDGREIFTLTSATKWKAERCGLGAMKSWLERALRKTIKANLKKEGK